MGEKELLQSVVAKSRAEAEAELQKEEELLRITIAQSLAKKAREEKDEQEKEELLIQEAITQSLAEDTTNKEKIKRDEEEQLQQALAFILAEEAKLSKDELLEEGIHNPLSKGNHPELDWELEEVLKLSEEKEHVGEDQEGQLKQPASRDLLGSEVKISKDKVVCDNVQKSLSKGEEFGSELEMYKLSLEENEHTGKEEQQLKKPPENIKLCFERSDDSEAKKSLESIALDSEN